MGHIGLTPQGISVLGGFRAQGRTAIKGRKIVDDALRLQDAGAFAVGKSFIHIHRKMLSLHHAPTTFE